MWGWVGIMHAQHGQQLRAHYTELCEEVSQI
jgi:hypothetical protein